MAEGLRRCASGLKVNFPLEARMKTMMTWLLGLAMALLSGLALADARVHSMTGTVSAATGPAPAQPVKVGDTIRSGQTAVTGANSTVVLQFPDGQLAALTPNSRMTIEQYQYNEQARSGNVLLNLVSGGMRAITGLIGRNSPEKVSYKAATATIGIRGTDITLANDAGTVTVIVGNGTVSFTYNGQTVTIPQGSAVNVRTVATPGGPTVTTIKVEPAAAIIQAIRDSGQAGSATIAALLTANSASVQNAVTSAATPNTATVGNPTVVTTTTSSGQQQTVITQPKSP
jgi:hypothetical protein